MKSLVLTRDGLQLADTVMPSILPGHTMIEVRSVGVCSTDLAIWKKEMDARLPLVLGHEIGGVIHDSSDSSVRAGEYVTVEVDISCGRCWYCINGLKHHCVARRTLGITLDGGLSEYIVVPSENLHILPEGVDVDAATFVEPLATAIAVYDRVPARTGEHVLIIGANTMGLLTAQIYDAYGADVQIAAASQRELGLARQIGFTSTINTLTQDWERPVLDLTHGAGSRVIIETTGTAKGLEMSLKLVRSQGVVALVSILGHTLPVDSSKIVDKEIQVLGVSRGPFDKAIDMLAKGRIEFQRLVTRHFQLEEGHRAFEYASQPDVQKVIITL